MRDTYRNGLSLAAMCLATFIAILDTSLVNLGLHSIQNDLHSGMTTLQWVIDLYNLAYAVLILTGGALCDLFGRRRIFIIGVLIFAIGSLICAIAPGAAILIAGRGIAGIGAALELPAALAILNVTYPDARKRASAIALWGGMNGLAMAIGPTTGGLLVDSFGWRSLFYVVLPFAAATVALAIGYVSESADPQGWHLDLPGQLLAVVTLATLSFGFIEGPGLGWQSPAVLGCLAGGIIGLAAFLTVEHRSSHPLLPLSIFRNRAFSAAVADASLMTFGVYGLLFLLPLYFQMIRRDSAVIAGVALLPMSVTFFLVSTTLAGRLATKIGPRLLISCGMALTGIGMLLLSGLAAQTSYDFIGLALFAVGLGLGLITGPIATAAMANAPTARSGLSSGLVNVGRMVGATLGVAALGILFDGRVEAATQNVPRFMQGMHGAFLMGGTAELAGAAIALFWFRGNSLLGSQNMAQPQVSAPGSRLSRTSGQDY
jgi:MFS transporter, DHA2 family, methylenomycin A resistance protein